MSAPEPAATKPFAYALLRVVPRVERGECLNVGVALFCRRHDFLDLRTHLDAARLAALAPGVDPEPLRSSLDALRLVVAGDSAGGALAALEPSEVHAGLTDDPRATLDRLFYALVV